MSKYCLLTDGAGVGTLRKDTCGPAPKSGQPVPFKYLVGPKSTDAGAQPNCATLTAQGQTFTKGACTTEDATNFTFYTFDKPVPGQPTLCFMKPAITGVNGTVVTTLPDDPNSCFQNLYVQYQDVTCTDTGCGDHGSCGTNGVCSCTDGWSGVQCQSPPPASSNAGCDPKKQSCGNMGWYGTCQAAVNPNTGISGSGKCQCDILAGQQGNWCEQACSSEDATACGGPLRGYCVDSMYQTFTNKNAVSNRCVCVNGWSGDTCKIPPPGWTCDDKENQCTNVTTEDPTKTVPTGSCVNGVCNCHNSNDCTSTNTLGSAFTGVACQTPMPVQGASCSKTTECASPLTCISGVCTCPGSNTPQPSADFYFSLMKMLASMIYTPEGLAGLAQMAGIQKGIPLLIKYLGTKALAPAFQKQLLARLEDAALGKTLGKDAVSTLENSIGKRLAAKLMAKMSMKELMNTSITSASKEAAEMAMEEVFGALGPITSFVHIAGMLGMVLDATDVAGLQEKSSQAAIDATMLKMQSAVNNSTKMIQNGFYFPTKQYAQDTFPFLLKSSSSASKDKVATDVADYLGHLTVNSNGAAIVPMFTSPLAQQQSAELSAAEGTVLYKIAGDNLQVYDNLKQYWPYIVGAAVFIIAAIIGAAFGIKALARKKVLSKQ